MTLKYENVIKLVYVLWFVKLFHELINTNIFYNINLGLK